MKLLIITQKIDINDPFLGFFHHWVEEFSKDFEKITVICLEKGEYQLPANVSVHSLGKEERRSRFQYLLHFYNLIWKFRDQYDSVFVHMNQEYVLLAGIFWKLLEKKVFLWRNHAQGNLLTYLAVGFSHKVFCTSPNSYTARFKKNKFMPVGVQIPRRIPDIASPNTVLSIGRISPIKLIDIFIETLFILRSQGVNFHATVVGSPVNAIDFEYEKDMYKKAEDLVREQKILFKQGVAHHEAESFFAKSRFFVNITPDGSLDKTIFEAMATGSVVVTSNGFFKDMIPKECFIERRDPEYIANVLRNLFEIPKEKISEWRVKNKEYVKRNHSIETLARILLKEMVV